MSAQDNTSQNTPSAKFRQVCAAISTPPGQSGLAVIRLSGDGCAQAVDRLFKPSRPGSVAVADMPGYTCAVGDLVDPSDQRMIDQVVVTRFASPHSFTGEDVVEISCHGGSAVKQSILDCLFAQGVTPAEAGEFTKRAFVNGKLDLSQAEAVMDLIQAEAAKTSKAAVEQLHGQLSRRVRELSDQNYALLAQIELVLEYPEHEETPEAYSDLAQGIENLRSQTKWLAETFRQGKILREGLTVVIAGRPNAGKSSLLNVLSGSDRAIVTPVPGTTRDTVEETIDIGGLPVHLVDTAGLRETEDTVEKIGVDRARLALQKADLIFWLASPPLSDLDSEIDGIAAAARLNLPLVLVAGKDDLDQDQEVRAFLKVHFPELPLISFSALTGEGADQLRQTILEIYEKAGSSSTENLLITSSRHKACLDRAGDALSQASRALEQQIPLDLVASLLRGSADALAGITGDAVTDELVNAIFGRFCVGK